ncbi:MAG: AMP-binding protein, partial [bacterium]|nr:AMP-binding protein [bacterium]
NKSLWESRTLSSERVLAPGGPPEARLYRSGDLARWMADGNIEFLGRIDRQVKIRGYRIETGEIESCLLRHDDITEAVVIVRESGDGDKTLCAYYVLENNAGLELKLREYLAHSLPGYMIPSFFVRLDRIPLTANGKIDTGALPGPKTLIEAGYEAPRGVLEERMQKIWQEILELQEEGITDNFFNIGGDSLNAIQLLNEIHREFNVKIPLAEIFRLPTIRELTKYISTAVKEEFTN